MIALALRRRPASSRRRPPASSGRADVFARAAWLVTRKDLLIETRTGRSCSRRSSSRSRACSCSRSAFVREGRAVEDAAAGILWIAIAFSGTLALGRAFERERQGETLRALLIAPSTGRRSTSASCSAS